MHDGETSNHLRNIRIDISTPLGRPEFPSFLDVDRTIEAESEDGSLLEGNHTPVVSCAMDRSASHPNTHATLGPNPLSREQSLVSTHFSGTFDTVVWHRLFINLIPVLGGLGLAASQAALKVGFWNPPSQWSLITAVRQGHVNNVVCTSTVVILGFKSIAHAWPKTCGLLMPFVCLAERMRWCDRYFHFWPFLQSLAFISRASAVFADVLRCEFNGPAELVFC